MTFLEFVPHFIRGLWKMALIWSGAALVAAAALSALYVAVMGWRYWRSSQRYYTRIDRR